MAKRVRWSDDGTVEVREMRDAETVLAIIHESQDASHESRPLESRVR